MVASSNTVPSAPVLLNFDDETKVNNMLILDTPKSVTQAAKEAKKASAQVSKEDDGSSNKKAATAKTDAKASNSSAASNQSTSVAQVESSTSNNAAPEEPQSTGVQTEKTSNSLSVELASVTPDISKLQPETNVAIIDALLKQSTQTAPQTTVTPVATPTITTATVITNGGFTTDGVSAILNISTGKGTIFYKVKVDTNATFSITDQSGTKEYPLNFGSKLKVNITQK
jgi:hypothetical protein